MSWDRVQSPALQALMLRSLAFSKCWKVPVHSSVIQETPVLEHSGSSSAYKLTKCSHIVADYIFQTWHRKTSGSISSSRALPPAAGGISPALESGQDLVTGSSEGMGQK